MPAPRGLHLPGPATFASGHVAHRGRDRRAGVFLRLHNPRGPRWRCRRRHLPAPVPERGRDQSRRPQYSLGFRSRACRVHLPAEAHRRTVGFEPSQTDPELPLARLSAFTDVPKTAYLSLIRVYDETWKPSDGTFFTIFASLLKLAGWIIVLIGVAALTGLLRRGGPT